MAQAVGLRTAVVFGGVGQNPQVTALAQGVDVLIACPGRLEDLIGQGHCRLDAVEVTVLDEADHMADLGFLPGVKRLMDATPVVGQRLLFSATLDNGIDVLVKRYLSEPVVHSVDPAVAPVSTMEHHVLEVATDTKAALVRELAAGQGRTVLFTRTKHSAKKLAKQLTAAGIPAVDLHGNLSQNARERNLGAFSDGSVRVLCATDIAARGIHVDEVGLVVHVDRRPSTRPTCTAPAARRAPAPAVSSSRWRPPTSAATSARWRARRASRRGGRPSAPVTRSPRSWSARPPPTSTPPTRPSRPPRRSRSGRPSRGRHPRRAVAVLRRPRAVRPRPVPGGSRRRAASPSSRGSWWPRGRGLARYRDALSGTVLDC